MAVVVATLVVVVGVGIVVALVVGVVAVTWSQAADQTSAARAPVLASSVELPCSVEQVEVAVERRGRRRRPVEV